MINVEVLADSVNIQGDRLTTFLGVFPRYVLAEFNTHRMFSRNSASSRAIPFRKMIKKVEENPFIPIAWQKAHTGMQGTEYLTEESDIKEVNEVWINAMYDATNNARDLADDTLINPITKQLANRLLEPFMWHTVLFTSGEHGLENFFELRCPQYGGNNERLGEVYFKSRLELISALKKAGINTSNLKINNDLEWLQINKGGADIHISLFAEKVYDAYNKSVPKVLNPGEWHLPYGDNINKKLINAKMISDHCGVLDTIGDVGQIEVYDAIKIKIATARCARTSYKTLGDNPKIDYQADINLHDKLIVQSPPHSSPAEHIAKAMTDKEYYTYFKGELIFDKNRYGWCYNIKGFRSYRSMLDV